MEPIQYTELDEDGKELSRVTDYGTRRNTPWGYDRFRLVELVDDSKKDNED
jgi:hypothetical protein